MAKALEQFHHCQTCRRLTNPEEGNGKQPPVNNFSRKNYTRENLNYADARNRELRLKNTKFKAIE